MEAHDHPHDDQTHEHAHDHAHDHEQPREDHGHAHDEQAHDHGDDHAHAHHDHADAEHEHAHPGGVLGLLAGVFHTHEHAVEFDEGLEASSEGIRTLWLSLLGLGITATIQLVIALRSGSVGLLADTIHNFSDALTAIPLWLAFVVGRWPANRRYTYGYGRAEDLAGVVIVLIIIASALLALWVTIQRFLHPIPMRDVVWVMAAAVVGFLGNEIVSVMRIRTGRRIGSAALEADGYHARVDGLTSLGVLVGAVAVWLGLGIADPIVGLLITVAIVFVSKDAAVAMWHRIMDAVDPALVGKAEQVIRETPGVQDVRELRLRWSGHRLLAVAEVTVNEDLPLGKAHAIGEEVRHRLFHALPKLDNVTLHLDPTGASGVDHHAATQHHRAGRESRTQNPESRR
jgi:cation diffusion facilitator family transporter